MREDILAGLKNAMARGATLEQAVQSFINAGYNSLEVNQAAQTLIQGATQIINPSQEIQKQPIIPQQIIQQQMPQNQSHLQQTFQQNLPIKPIKAKRKLGLIIFLIITLFILIGALVLTIFFGEELLSKILN